MEISIIYYFFLSFSGIFSLKGFCLMVNLTLSAGMAFIFGLFQALELGNENAASLTSGKITWKE